MFQNSPSYKVFFSNGLSAWAAGAEYARQSVLGPLSIGVQWCNITGLSASLLIGFDF